MAVSARLIPRPLLLCTAGARTGRFFMRCVQTSMSYLTVYTPWWRCWLCSSFCKTDNTMYEVLLTSDDRNAYGATELRVVTSYLSSLVLYGVLIFDSSVMLEDTCRKSVLWAMKCWNVPRVYSGCCPFHIHLRLMKDATRKHSQESCNVLWSCNRPCRQWR